MDLKALQSAAERYRNEGTSDPKSVLMLCDYALRCLPKPMTEEPDSEHEILIRVTHGFEIGYFHEVFRDRDCNEIDDAKWWCELPPVAEAT